MVGDGAGWGAGGAVCKASGLAQPVPSVTPRSGTRWSYDIEFGQVSSPVRTSVSSTVKWGRWSLTCRAV